MHFDKDKLKIITDYVFEIYRTNNEKDILDFFKYARQFDELNVWNLDGKPYIITDQMKEKTFFFETPRELCELGYIAPDSDISGLAIWFDDEPFSTKDELKELVAQSGQQFEAGLSCIDDMCSYIEIEEEKNEEFLKKGLTYDRGSQ